MDTNIPIVNSSSRLGQSERTKRTTTVDWDRKFTSGEFHGVARIRVFQGLFFLFDLIFQFSKESIYEPKNACNWVNFFSTYLVFYLVKKYGSSEIRHQTLYIEGPTLD